MCSEYLATKYKILFFQAHPDMDKLKLCENSRYYAKVPGIWGKGNRRGGDCPKGDD